ncbi:hypothetical protein AUP68_02470 [Ilyonectria robusta]
MSSTHKHYVSDLITGPPPTEMGYNRLGRSGLKVSKIILGAMSYGSKEWQKWVLEEDEALPLLKHAYDVGINTWDTSDLYSNGVSEEIIGKALSTYSIPREGVVIITKCRWGISGPGEPQLSVFASTINDGRMVNRVGLSRKHIFDAVQASVKRLGTYIDVLQIHRMDQDVPREEIMKALNDVVEMGLARSQHDVAIPRLYGRESEIDKAIVDAVEEIAKARNLPMAVIATAWCLHKGVNPIVGLNTKERIDEAVLAAKTALTEEEVEKLEAAYQPKNMTGH